MERKGKERKEKRRRKDKDKKKKIKNEGKKERIKNVFVYLGFVCNTSLSFTSMLNPVSLYAYK